MRAVRRRALPARLARRVGLFRLHPLDLVALALAIAAGAWAFFGSQAIFPYLSNNHDEPVYLLQADALVHGELFPDAPTAQTDAFQPWFAYQYGSNFVPKYPPVYPAVLAVGKLVFGTEHAGQAMVAAGLVFLLYLLAREVRRSRVEALIAAGLFAAAPLFLIQTATFLPYASGLLLLEGFAWLLLRGIRCGSGWTLGASGLFAGAAFFARPFDTVLFAIPLLAYLGFAQRRAVRRLLGSVLALVAGAVLPLAALLVYNRAATGSAFALPFSRYSPLDKLGFGLRQQTPVEPGVYFTFSQGLEGLVDLTALTMLWSFGGILLVELAHWGLLRRERAGPEPWLAAVAVTVPLGYVFYYGGIVSPGSFGSAHYLGPSYYFPVLVPIAILGAGGLLRLWRRSVLLALLGVVAMTAWTAVVLRDALRTNAAYTAENRRLYRPLEQAKLQHALVFVPPLYGAHLLHPLAWMRNSAKNDGRIEYVLDRGSVKANAAAAALFPGRTRFVFHFDGTYTEEPYDAFTTSLERLR